MTTLAAPFPFSFVAGPYFTIYTLPTEILYYLSPNDTKRPLTSKFLCKINPDITL